MTTQVVILGAGYAGAGAVQSFEEAIGDEAELTWVSEHDYHLVLHEAHRVIRDPDVARKITLPVSDIKSPRTTFLQGRVEDVDVDERVVSLADGETIEYDYLLVALGTATAFYGIEGLAEYSYTLKSLADARDIHDAVAAAAEAASRSDPAQIRVGGAGLSGIQSAGEIAEYRDRHDAPLEVSLVEGLEEIFPGNDPEVQGALRKRLEERDVDIITGEFISKVDAETISLGGGENEPPRELDYDVLVWTGGITGHDEVAGIDVEQDERSHRVTVSSDFRTSDDRVFCIGDSALVEQSGDDVAPPTAQAAWQAAEVAGENLARAVRGRSLETWRYEDKGTLVSVGEEAVAHNVKPIPVNTFGGPVAKFLKKAVAARWIADVTSIRRALDAWDDM